jgi:hypothetical protein
MDLMSPRHLKAANWAVLAVLVLGGLIWQGKEFALGVLVGGLVVVVNFHVLDRLLQNTLNRARVGPGWDKGTAQAWFAGKHLLRFFALVAIIAVLVIKEWVNIWGLVVGLSTVVLSLTLVGLNEARKIMKKEANSSHGTSSFIP